MENNKEFNDFVLSVTQKIDSSYFAQDCEDCKSTNVCSKCKLILEFLKYMTIEIKKTESLKKEIELLQMPKEAFKEMKHSYSGTNKKYAIKKNKEKINVINTNFSSSFYDILNLDVNSYEFHNFIQHLTDKQKKTILAELEKDTVSKATTLYTKDSFHLSFNSYQGIRKGLNIENVTQTKNTMEKYQKLYNEFISNRYDLKISNDGKATWVNNIY